MRPAINLPIPYLTYISFSRLRAQEIEQTELYAFTTVEADVNKSDRSLR